MVWGVALASMCVGNFAALWQTNIKRMLAYSSIAHAGYVLVALAANTDTGAAAAMFYLAAYALMNIGAFSVVSYLSGRDEPYQNIEDFKGLGRRQPLAAAMFSIFLLSLIGVPLTGGFFGKFYIFKAALESHLVWLSILGLLNSAVAAYYYLRILVMMYMYEPAEATESAEPIGPSVGFALILPALGTLILGIFPTWVLDFATRSAALIR
jgi:NADH-quinone oxidoreductase subunit N